MIKIRVLMSLVSGSTKVTLTFGSHLQSCIGEKVQKGSI